MNALFTHLYKYTYFSWSGGRRILLDILVDAVCIYNMWMDVLAR